MVRQLAEFPANKDPKAPWLASSELDFLANATEVCPVNSKLRNYRKAHLQVLVCHALPPDSVLIGPAFLSAGHRSQCVGKKVEDISWQIATGRRHKGTTTPFPTWKP